LRRARHGSTRAGIGSRGRLGCCGSRGLRGLDRTGFSVCSRGF